MYLDFLSEHLSIFDGDLLPQRNKCHEVDVTMSEIMFEFSCDFDDEKIIKCGVQIMTEEAEGSSSRELDNFVTESSRSEVDSYETESSSSKVDNFETESSSSKVDYYETGDNNNHHTDGDGDYEAEGFKFSNFETESSISEVDYYETGGDDNHHTDGDGDGDGDYEAEGFKLSQDENIKTSKHTGFRSWLMKLGLKMLCLCE